MNLEDKIKELEQLKLDRDVLITKKDKLIKDRHSKLNFIINLLLTSAVFTIFMKIFDATSIVALLLSSIAYIIVVPGFAYHRNKVKINILDVDINNLDNNIDKVKKQIIELERENLLSIVRDKIQENNEKQITEFREMPLFDRENLENNICEVDSEMKLILRR